MFKIDKCIRLIRKIPFLKERKWMSSKDDNAYRICPPSYECKQPVNTYVRFDWDELKKKNVHPLVSCKRPPDLRPWRNIFLYVFLPIIVGMFIHLKTRAKDERRYKYIEFSYLRRIKKPWPWHPVKTLFHNPMRNALPGGYETEVPEEMEIDPRNCPVPLYP